MKKILAAIPAAALMVACGGGSSQTMQPAAVVPPPEVTQPMSVNFTSFVKTMVVEHSNAVAPLDISKVSFAFTDDENPTAFADVLPPAT